MVKVIIFLPPIKEQFCEKMVMIKVVTIDVEVDERSD